jgi:hypothetical protein
LQLINPYGEILQKSTEAFEDQRLCKLQEREKLIIRQIHLISVTSADVVVQHE